MQVRENIKKGIIVLGIYVIVTIYLLFLTERIDKLNNNSLRNSNGSISLIHTN